MLPYQKIVLRPGILILSLSAAVMISATAFMLLLPFDGIEFNGDSFVYFKNAIALSEAFSENRFPESTHWPYGYPALLSLAFAVGDVSFESARWVNVIAGGFLMAALCGLLLLLARLKKMPDQQTFLIILSAGLWTLAHGYFLKYQLSMMSDISAALWGTLMILACWKWRVSGNLFAIALAGAALGLAVFTRYVYILMAIPAVVIFISDTNLRSKTFVKKIVPAAFLFGATALLIFSPQFFLTISDLSHTLGNGLFQDWNIQNFFTLSYESIDGHQTADIPAMLYYALLPFQWKCFTPFSLLLVIAGVRYAVRELPRWVWLSLASWYGIMYLLICGIPIQNARIAFPLFMPLLVVISLGMLECLFLWKNHFRKLLGSIAVLWLVSFVFSARHISGLVKMKNELKATADSVANSIPENSRIISTSLCAVYLAYPSTVEPFSIYKTTIPQAEQLLSEGKSVFLAIDEDRFGKQWSSYPPGKCYAWIRNNFKCEPLFKVKEFTVYSVRKD